jgi:hypothetical protein
LGQRFVQLGQDNGQVSRAFRSFNGYHPDFRAASDHFAEEPAIQDS